MIILTQHSAEVLCHKTEQFKHNIYTGLNSLLNMIYEGEHNNNTTVITSHAWQTQ